MAESFNKTYCWCSGKGTSCALSSPQSRPPRLSRAGGFFLPCGRGERGAPVQHGPWRAFAHPRPHPRRQPRAGMREGGARGRRCQARGAGGAARGAPRPPRPPSGAHSSDLTKVHVLSPTSLCPALCSALIESPY